MSYLILFGILLFGNNFKTSSAIALDCTFENRNYALVGSLYTCTARALFDESDKVVTVYGLHQSGRGNDDVHSLHLHSQNLPFVPTNIESFFPNIRTLYFYNNSITNVNNKHLIPFENLEYLQLGENMISTLDSNLFSGLRAMKVLSFNSNNITNIGHDINLPSEGVIDFGLNSCISTFASTAVEIATLKLNLLRNCPPTISQIEDTLESRPNLLTDLSYKNVQLETRIALLEGIIENKLGIKLEEAVDNES